ncbi:MAG TPA: two-component regulator propeller domain-containing protein [Puia sp.]|nr:two-component regulator propeller domain-containing protein [Puia sp.]
MAANQLIAICQVFCTAFILNATAQENPHFVEKLTTTEGLSSNRVNDLVQDDKGFLWVATSDGLNRYDGTEITQYFYKDSANSLPHNYVYCLKKLPGNMLAIGTQSGLSFYNGNTGLFRNFYYARNNALDEYNNVITGLELDAKGHLWAASRNCIYIFNEQLTLIKVFRSSFTAADALRERLRYIGKMIPLSDGHVLLSLYDGWYIGAANADGLTRIELSAFKDQLGFIKYISTPALEEKKAQDFPEARVFKVYDRYLLCIPPDKDSLLLMDERGHRVSACVFPYNKYPYVLWSQQVVAVDSGRILFLFHNYGLGIISVSWPEGRPVLHKISPVLFERTEYNNAFCDRQHNWWLATSAEGLQKISPHKQSFRSHTLIEARSGQPLHYEATHTSRYQDNLWVATYGEGFFKIDLPSGRQQQFRLQHTGDDTWANFVWTVRQIHPDTLWVGTQKGLFWYCLSRGNCGRLNGYAGQPSVLDSVPVTTQFVDREGLVWMGLGRGKGLCYFDAVQRRFTWLPGNSSRYPLRYPLVWSEDRNGRLWCTNDASTLLLCRDRGKDRFREVALPATLKRQVSNLYGICCEDDSIIWLGSVTSGLIKFNVLHNTLTLYGHDRGLVNSHISSIYQDGTKRLWLVTEGGISCFDPRTELFFNYSENDGLPVKYPTAFFFYDTLAKCLYSGGKGAVFSFDPSRLNACQPPQETLITAMQVNGRPCMFTPDEPVLFSAQQNDITIHYATIDLTGNVQTKYMYKLIGEDTGWVMAGPVRQINFSHLPAGHYTFVVRSQNNRGIWSRGEACLSFFIRPPFTETAWFYALIALLLSGGCYGLYRLRGQQRLRTEQMRNEISRNLHDEVGSTLTNISLGSLLAQKQLQMDGLVGPLLERIYQDSQTVSQTMREIVWSINPRIDTLGEALPCMLQYASELLEAKDIVLKAEIDPAIERIRLTMQKRRDLYLIFKEAVTNLARHSDAENAHIRFELAGTKLVMTIADDGKGFDGMAPVMSNGLKNMKERAASHHWRLDIRHNDAIGNKGRQGVTLRLCLPAL